MSDQYPEEHLRDYYLGMGVPFVDLTVFKPDSLALNSISVAVARKFQVLPVKRDNNTNTLFVAMADINDLRAHDTLRLASRCLVRAVVAAPREILAAIDRCYSDPSSESVVQPGKASEVIDPLSKAIVRRVTLYNRRETDWGVVIEPVGHAYTLAPNAEFVVVALSLDKPANFTINEYSASTVVLCAGIERYYLLIDGQRFDPDTSKP